MKAGEYKAALAYNDSVLTFDRNDAEAYSWRGLAKYDLGDKQGAIEDHREAIRLDPNLGNQKR
jgi:tetratricopeptide (TPR) repeat protein